MRPEGTTAAIAAKARLVIRPDGGIWFDSKTIECGYFGKMEFGTRARLIAVLGIREDPSKSFDVSMRGWSRFAWARARAG